MWNISYQNLMMLSASIPVYESNSEKVKPGKQKKGEDYDDSGDDLAAFLGVK